MIHCHEGALSHKEAQKAQNVRTGLAFSRFVLCLFATSLRETHVQMIVMTFEISRKTGAVQCLIVEDDIHARMSLADHDDQFFCSDSIVLRRSDLRLQHFVVFSDRTNVDGATVFVSLMCQFAWIHSTEERSAASSTDVSILNRTVRMFLKPRMREINECGDSLLSSELRCTALAQKCSEAFAAFRQVHVDAGAGRCGYGSCQFGLVERAVSRGSQNAGRLEVVI